MNSRLYRVALLISLLLVCNELNGQQAEDHALDKVKSVVQQLEKQLAKGQGGVKEFSEAMSVIDQAIAQEPNSQVLLETAVDFKIRFGRLSDAIRHLNTLIENGRGDDSPLRLKLAECLGRTGSRDRAMKELAKLTGYDFSNRTFVETAATAPTLVRAYEVLAFMIEDEAAKLDIANQMVNANVDSHEAYLKRSQILRRIVDQSTIEKDLIKAHQLAPSEPAVIIALGDFYLQQKQVVVAKEYFQTFRRLFPEKFYGYERLAAVAAESGNYQEAVVQFTSGLERLGENEQLLWGLFHVQLRQQDFDGADATWRKLEKSVPKNLSAYVDAQMDFARGNWELARTKLEEIKVDVFLSRKALSAPLHSSLQQCYKELGLDTNGKAPAP